MSKGFKRFALGFGLLVFFVVLFFVLKERFWWTSSSQVEYLEESIGGKVCSDMTGVVKEAWGPEFLPDFHYVTEYRASPACIDAAMEQARASGYAQSDSEGGSEAHLYRGNLDDYSESIVREGETVLIWTRVLS